VVGGDDDDDVLGEGGAHGYKVFFLHAPVFLVYTICRRMSGPLVSPYADAIGCLRNTKIST